MVSFVFCCPFSLIECVACNLFSWRVSFSRCFHGVCRLQVSAFLAIDAFRVDFMMGFLDRPGWWFPFSPYLFFFFRLCVKLSHGVHVRCLRGNVFPIFSLLGTTVEPSVKKAQVCVKFDPSCCSKKGEPFSWAGPLPSPEMVASKRVYPILRFPLG